MADEAKFQISVRKELFRCAPLHVYMAYTQRSQWQVYDKTNSRPFRATDYNPELNVELRAESSGARPSLFRFGVEHESNGQSDPYSRSWNRVYLQPGWGSPKTEGITVKLWWRIPEPSKSSPTDTSGDDNPDIEDYLGVAELNVWCTWSTGGRWQMLLRRGTRDGTETAQIDWDLPIGFLGSGVAFRMEGFSGYGETLIDYNRRVSRIGVGIVFR
jgi:phospholipase A1